MKFVWIQLFALLHVTLLWKDAAANSPRFFLPAITTSAAPLNVYVGAGEPQWMNLTEKQSRSVSLYEMHVVVTPAVCPGNSSDLICFGLIHCRNNSTGDNKCSNSDLLNGTCNNGEDRKVFKYSNFKVIHPGELLGLQIVVCDNGSRQGDRPELAAECNITSPDCLCVNACLPMWVAVRVDAIYSYYTAYDDNCTDRGSFEVIDREPEETLLLSLHNTTTATQMDSCTRPHWVLQHIGTIAASAVALLLLGVIVALLGGITGYWSRGRAKKKSLTAKADPSPPPAQEQEQQEKEQEQEEARDGLPPSFRAEGEEKVMGAVSYIRGSYEDLDVIMSDEGMPNSTQGLVATPPVVYGSSAQRSPQPLRMKFSQVQHTLAAAKYEVPLPRSQFWQPTPVENEIIKYMSNRDTTLINQDQIKLLEKLGEGEFGSVYHGLWHKEGGEVDSVAVKMAQNGMSAVDRTKLLQEAAIMGQFSHENVIMLKGVVKNKDTVMIITEFLSNGDLRLHLKSVEMEVTFTPSLLEDLPSQLLHFGQQIAEGMKYLSQRAFVHRDLAARNVLLDKNYICKIADFGLSRDLAEGEYYRSRGGKIPVKWTAPEALHYRKYTTSSDVWSYGMVLFEIWSLGQKPFGDMSISQVANLPNAGYCQPPPPGCPRRMYQLMVECWNPDTDKRPPFSGIVDYLSQPEATLLHWAEDDKTKSPSCAVLGAELGAGRTLYEDLQKRYSESADGRAQRRGKVNTLDEGTMLGF